MKYKERNITIILGAGASKAYARLPYPLLPDLLPEILEYADGLESPNQGGRQRLLLAYALITAYGIAGPDLTTGSIPAAVIQEEFECVKALPRSDLCLTTVFEKLEKLPDQAAGTRAYWALTHAIGIYMFQMAKKDINQSHVGIAHVKLIDLIDKMLSEGISVNVVDFNYDCVLEHIRYSRGKARFSWNCGRERKVIVDTAEDTTLSALVETNRFRAPKDEEDEKKSSAWVGLIKPHGDMCTFLRGKTDVFYRGGRHSQTTSATYPPKLTDISPTDQFVRSSILPPTHSRHRHGSQFYTEEEQRLRQEPSNCNEFIIIGWSASGTDNYYQDIFRPIFKAQSPGPRLYVIDWRPDGVQDPDLRNRFLNLFGDKVTFKSWQMCGFNEAAVEELEQSIFSAD